MPQNALKTKEQKVNQVNELLKLGVTPTMARAEMCRRSFRFFVSEFWDTIVNQPLSPNWHIDLICLELQAMGLHVIARKPKLYDLILNVPPGSSKSTLCSILFPAWLWAMDPHLDIITGSYSSALGLELANKSRDVIRSDKYRIYFPNVQLRPDQDSKSNYQTTKGGARYTTSTGGSVTGLHADFIIIDDPQNPELANSEPGRHTTNEWVTSTLSSRKNDRAITPTMVVQQRLHRDDVTGHILGRGREWKHVCLPAELTETSRAIPNSVEPHYKEGLLDPIRLSRKTLNEAKIDLGTAAYASQMLQNPGDATDRVIDPSWVPIVEKQPIGVVDFWADTAFTDNSKNDPSAIVATVFVPSERCMYIVGAWHGHLESPELMRHMQNYVTAIGTRQSRLKIEPKASGQSIVPLLRSMTNLNVSEAENPTKSKLERLRIVAPHFEAMRIKMVRGPWNHLITDELFVNEPVHDDVRDCVVMAAKECFVDFPATKAISWS